MIETRRRDRRPFKKARAASIDGNRFLDMECRPIFLAVLSKEKVALGHQVDQLFELVRNAEVPHRRAQNDSVCLPKTFDQ